MSDWNKNQGQGGQGQGGQGQGGQGQGGQGQGKQGQGGQGQGGQGQGGQGQGGQGQGKQGQGGQGQGGHGKQGQGTHAQGGPGAWVWLRWNDSAPENIRKDFENSGYESWNCKTGEWNCKFWVPATTEAEAKKAFEAKIGNKDYIKNTKYEWNWNQSTAA